MMTATGFEHLGELEAELEEEAAELELLFPRGRAGTMAAPREAPSKLTDPLPYGCIDVSGRCISVGCAAPYKCVRRLLGGCECRPGKLCPKAPDPASGKCLRVLRRDGNYLVCCPKYYGFGDPCCRVYPIPSRLMPATEFELPGELEDEFEEEATELEPFFARGGALEFGGPAHVRRWARNAAYQGDLNDELEEEAMELEPFFPRGGSITQPYCDGKWGQAFYNTTWALPEFEDGKACKTTYAVPGFAPGSSKLADFQKKHIKDFVTKIARSLALELKGKRADIEFELLLEGHVDKKTDPLKYGSLDNDRTDAVASEIIRQTDSTMGNILLALGHGLLFSYKYSLAGPNRPFSKTNSAQNRRVVVVWKCKIKPKTP
jgi:hypothetical protein